MRLAYSAALLLVVVLAVFLPTTGYEFVYEDFRETRLTLDPGAITHQISVQPFRTGLHLSRALDMALFGIQPWGFHLGSVLWHAVNVLLVLAVGWLVLPPWPAMLMAGIFALHPLQMEAVAYVSARADLVATCGVLLALLAASLGSVAGAVLGVVFACVGKETAIVAWALVPLWAAWTQAVFPVRRWLVMGSIGAALSAAVMLSQIRDSAMGFDLSIAAHAAGELWRQLFGLIWMWDYTIEPTAVSPAWQWVALVATCWVTVWALAVSWQQRNVVGFAWLWTLIALSPRFVVPLYEGLHDRHLYICLVGWAFCAGSWLSEHAHGATMYGITRSTRQHA